MDLKNLSKDRRGIVGVGAGLLANPMVLMAFIIIVLIALVILTITGTIVMAYIGAFVPAILILLGIVAIMGYIPALKGVPALAVGALLLAIGAGMAFGILPHFQQLLGVA